MYSNGEVVKIGTPSVQDVRVSGTIIGHPRGEKIRVAKFKAKARYRRVSGHRQSLSRVKIDEIVFPVSQKSEKKQVKKPQPIKKKTS